MHDVERMLGRLDPFSQKLIAKIVLQGVHAGRGGAVVGMLAENGGAAISRSDRPAQRNVSGRRTTEAV